MKAITHLPQPATLMPSSHDLYRVQQRRNPDGSVEILSMQGIDGKNIPDEQKQLRQIPEQLSEEHSPSTHVFEEWLLKPSALNESHRRFLGRSSLLSSESWPGAEVRTLISQGPVANRVNLTIVGDGYTEAERTRFFEDAQRITREMFVGQAFASFLPLFNVHAVFVPSRESGITDVENRDTALGLYRSPKGSKRAIMPGNSEAARRALRLAPATDYAVLLANDEFYGGLGGEFAITTRSLNSGSMVLHHEFGHNISEVGEEYDGGQVYSGANFSRSKNVSWDEWVDGKLKVENGQSLVAAYPWKNLSTGPYAVKFSVPGKAGENILDVDLSSVGWESADDVEVLIDGKVFPVEGIFTHDRSFFRIKDTGEIGPGRHELLIRQKKTDGNNVLAAVRIAVYPSDYDLTPGKVAAYPLFNSAGQFVGYRPTHQSCLMRDMRYKKFCPVDQQSIWHNLLRRVDLIDGVEAVKSGSEVNVSITTPDLLGLSIRWYVVKEGREEELTEFRDQKSWQREGLSGKEFAVKVSYKTEEVREYTPDFENQLRFHVE